MTVTVSRCISTPLMTYVCTLYVPVYSILAPFLSRHIYYIFTTKLLSHWRSGGKCNKKRPLRTKNEVRIEAVWTLEVIDVLSNISTLSNSWNWKRCRPWSSFFIFISVTWVSGIAPLLHCPPLSGTGTKVYPPEASAEAAWISISTTISLTRTQETNCEWTFLRFTIVLKSKLRSSLKVILLYTGNNMAI